MNDRRMKMRWSDVWLLLSIYYANRSQQHGLSAFIAFADHMNHLIISYDELASGLFRLEKNDLIESQSGLNDISCSHKALDIITPLMQRIRSIYDLRIEVEKKLNASTWTPNEPLPHPDNDLEFRGLNRELYDIAVKEYLKSTSRSRHSNKK